MRFLLLTIHLATAILLLNLSAKGQVFPDSIIIIQYSYYKNHSGGDSLYKTDVYPIIKTGGNYFLNRKRIPTQHIRELVTSVSHRDQEQELLTLYKVDTQWIKNNPGALLDYNVKDRIKWNVKQKNFIYRELTDINNYRIKLNDHLLAGCCYARDHREKKEYRIRFISNHQITQEISSRRYAWGYAMPWTSGAGESTYSYDIEKSLFRILNLPQKTKPPPEGNKLLQILVQKIIHNYTPTLYFLAADSYRNEIDELKTDFQIISSEELYERGRYTLNEPEVIKIVLKNDRMLPNVRMVFMVSKKEKTLFNTTDIKRDYKDFIDRIQSLGYISQYLQNDTNRRLDIYYFNDKGINDYQIERVNSNPKKWASHDNWVFYVRNNEAYKNKPGFDMNKSIKISQLINCGCNYRFDRSYMEKAILFEITNENRHRSLWFLLPDDKVLLFEMTGNETMLYTKPADQPGNAYPCILYDKAGHIINNTKTGQQEKSR